MYKDQLLQGISSTIDLLMSREVESQQKVKIMENAGWLVYADLLEETGDTIQLEQAKAIRHEYSIQVAMTKGDIVILDEAELTRDRPDLEFYFNVKVPDIGFDIRGFGLFARKMRLPNFTCHSREHAQNIARLFQKYPERFQLLDDVTLNLNTDTRVVDMLLDCLPDSITTLWIALHDSYRAKTLAKFLKKQRNLKKLILETYSVKSLAFFDVFSKHATAEIEELTVTWFNKTFTTKLNPKKFQSLKRLVVKERIHMFDLAPARARSVKGFGHFLRAGWNFPNLETVTFTNVMLSDRDVLTTDLQYFLTCIPDVHRLKRIEVCCPETYHSRTILDSELKDTVNTVKSKMGLTCDLILKIT